MSKPKETLLIEAYSPLPSSTDQIPTPPRHRKLLKLVIPITLSLCLAAFVFGLVLGFVIRPHDIHVYVHQAKIKEFNLISNTTVHCKVEFIMAFRNPNKMASVHYKSLHATSFYEGTRFGSIRLPKFRQGRESYKTFDVVLEGKPMMAMNWRVEEFYRVKEKGFVDLEVRGYTRIKYKIGFFKTKTRHAMVMCVLKRVALATTNETYGRFGGFMGTRCAVYV